MLGPVLERDVTGSNAHPQAQPPLPPHSAGSREPGFEAELIRDGSSGAVDMQAPVLYFEVEDPAGPLDAAGTDLGSHFGRLQVKDAAVGTVFNMGGSGVASYLSILQAA